MAERPLVPLPSFAQDLRTRGSYAVKGNISNEQSVFSHGANVKKKVALESPVRGDRNTDGGGASEASATPGKAPPTNRTALAVAGKIEDRAFHSVGAVQADAQVYKGADGFRCLYDCVGVERHLRLGKAQLWRPPGARPWDGLVPQPRAFQALAGGYAYRTRRVLAAPRPFYRQRTYFHWEQSLQKK